MCRPRIAFSLIELMIGVALVLFVICMVVPRIKQHPRASIEQELDQLEALFYALQQRAMARGITLYLIFDLDHQRYSYRTMQGSIHTQHLPSKLRFGVVDGALGPPWQAMTPVQRPATFELLDGRPTVKFFHNGKISSGTLYICDRDKTDGGALTCAVSQVFYIRKYLYDDKQWKLMKAQ